MFNECLEIRWKLLIFASLIYPSKILCLRSNVKHSTQCFITRWNTSKFVKNTPLRVVFLTLFLVFHLVMNHCVSFLIYYLKNRQKLTGKFGLLYKLRCFTGRLSLKRSWLKKDVKIKYTNITKLLFSGNQWLTSCCLLW